MKLIWKSGQTREVPMAGSVHGARLDGIRPSSIELTGPELLELAEAIRKEAPTAVNSFSYVKHLANALTR